MDDVFLRERTPTPIFTIKLTKFFSKRTRNLTNFQCYKWLRFSQENSYPDIDVYDLSRRTLDTRSSGYEFSRSPLIVCVCNWPHTGNLCCCWLTVGHHDHHHVKIFHQLYNKIFMNVNMRTAHFCCITSLKAVISGTRELYIWAMHCLPKLCHHTLATMDTDR